jgi:hypothetical protein
MQDLEIPVFKCRCSQIGSIMTNDRSGKGMGETAKTYVKDWLRLQTYGHEKEIKSKYLVKGRLLEDEAIRFYIHATGCDFLLKNEERFENDFFTGEPDVIDEIVYDFKNSWDAYSFPLFEKTPDKGYFAQLQGYMALTGLKKAKLVHVLLDTPEEITYGEPRDYSFVSNKFRIKEFEIDYDPVFIEQAQERVLQCREYLKEILSNL